MRSGEDKLKIKDELEITMKCPDGKERTVAPVPKGFRAVCRLCRADAVVFTDGVSICSRYGNGCMCFM
jgi:hypothetical protein